MIPNAAMPVVLILRDEVDKPDKEEMSLNSVGQPRFRGTHCPLGLIPCAIWPTPYMVSHLGERFCQMDISGFFLWWDCLTINQARDAVDEIWTIERMQHDSGPDSGLTEDSTQGSRGAKAVG